MAKIISGTQVGARGKAAGMVYQKGRKGETIQRRYVVPSNPRTGSQMAQRIIFATAAQAAMYMSSIIDHSFQGVKKGLDSKNEFVSRNVKILRSLAAADYAAKPSAAEAKMFVTTKGVSALIPNEYMISNGSLAKPRMKVEKQVSGALGLVLGSMPETVLSSITVSDTTYYGCTVAQLISSLFGINEISEQLTLCVIAQSDSEMMYSYNGQNDPGYEIPFTAFNARRLVFNPAADLSQTVILLNDDGTANDDADANIAAAVTSCFNSTDTDESLLHMIEVMLTGGTLTPGTIDTDKTASFVPAVCNLDEEYIYDIDNQEGHVYAGGVIRSKLVDGSWRRSKSFLVMAAFDADHNEGLLWALANDAWFTSQKVASSTLFLNEGGTANEVGESF